VITDEGARRAPSERNLGFAKLRFAAWPELRAAGLVQLRRRGREIYYTLADRRPAERLELARRPAP
jgi:DNA-binding transcriptional ArsR family regulator